MSIALQGAVIIEERSGIIRYHPKCEKCGTVNSNQQAVSGSPGPNSTTRTAFTCLKCQNRQDVVFKGV
jgi:hypothetical protein